MKSSELLDPVVAEIYQILEPNTPIEIPDYGWDNFAWSSSKFRNAHLQYFKTDKVAILHWVVFPHTNSDAPIYGYDVIEINGILTGMFLDLTPVNDQQYYCLPAVQGEHRQRPDWGDFFSPLFVCVRPEPEDLVAGVQTLREYLLNILPGNKDGDYSAQQQHYVDGQRKNPQTFRMLKSHIGEEKAHEFINTVLFPDI